MSPILHHHSIASLLYTRFIYLRGVCTHGSSQKTTSVASSLLCCADPRNRTRAIRLGSEHFHLLSHPASPATVSLSELLALFYRTCHSSQSLIWPDQAPGSAPSAEHCYLYNGCFNIFHKTGVLEQQKRISFWLEEAEAYRKLVQSRGQIT